MGKGLNLKGSRYFYLKHKSDDTIWEDILTQIRKRISEI